MPHFVSLHFMHRKISTNFITTTFEIVYIFYISYIKYSKISYLGVNKKSTSVNQKLIIVF